jgi:hypothetical protein
MTISKTAHTSQEIDNMSFDEATGIKVTEIMGADGILKNPATEETLQALTSATNLEGGGIVSVGTTAVEATFTGITKSVIITSLQTNTGILYIGKSNVTSAGANAFVALYAGESVSVDYNDATNGLYVVASAASQSFLKGATL